MIISVDELYGDVEGIAQINVILLYRSVKHTTLSCCLAFDWRAFLSLKRLRHDLLVWNSRHEIISSKINKMLRLFVRIPRHVHFFWQFELCESTRNKYYSASNHVRCFYNNYHSRIWNSDYFISVTTKNPISLEL